MTRVRSVNSHVWHHSYIYVAMALAERPTIAIAERPTIAIAERPTIAIERRPTMAIERRPIATAGLWKYLGRAMAWHKLWRAPRLGLGLRPGTSYEGHSD